MRDGDRPTEHGREVRLRGPDHTITVAAAGGRVTVIAGGRAIADSRNALVLREAGYAPVHYLPRADVDMAALHPSAARSWCPYKGEARYLTDGSVDIAWSYEQPHDAVAAIAGHLAFYPDRVDRIVLADR